MLCLDMCGGLVGSSNLSKVWLLLCVLSLVSGAYEQEFDDYEGPSGEDCLIRRNYKSPFVTALYERVDVAGGCQSQERSPDNREVHVVNILQKVEPAVLGVKIPEVTLQLKPRSSTDTNFSGRLIFILNSQQPILWKIQSEHMSNTTRHLFWISKDSRLRKEMAIRIKIKKQEMPHNTDELVSWVRQQHSAITSFTEVQHNVVSTIITKVGIDASVSERCEISSANYNRRPDIAAISLQKQKTNACIARNNRNFHGKDVHIIEVYSSDTAQQSADPADIVLDITQSARKPRQWSLILVLKSHRPVRWKIQTRGIKGGIEIITDHQVDSANVSLQSVSVAAEKLNDLEGSSLVEWTRERYGPAVSYTEAAMANKFVLIVDAAEMGPDPSAKSPLDTPVQTKAAVITARNVDCDTHGMKVALKKRILNSYGVYLQHLSLRDAQCVAKDNGTHYILETALNECQTVRTEADGQITYTNVILVSRLPDGVDLDLGEFSGSGYELVDMDTHIDDEEIGQKHKIDTIESEFKCQFPANVFGPLVDAATYSVNVFTDDSFSELVARDKFPLRVPGGATIYLQASVQGAEYVSVRVPYCVLTEETTVYQQTLITNSCVSGLHSVTLPTPDPKWFRFGFTTPPLASSQSERRYHVSCQLDACGRKSGADGQCPPANCDKTKPNIITILDSYTGPQYETGVIIVGLPAAVSSGELGSSECKQSHDQRAPGLDSTTVVGIAFAAFMIGVLLVAALWFIHNKTASKSSTQRPRFVETSGESTPSSTAPITIHQVNHH